MGTVLIIDDNVGTLTTSRLVLSRAGHEVLTAGSGKLGIVLAIGRVCDAILVDLHLEDMSGVQVVCDLKSAGIRVPIVVLTRFPEWNSSFDAAAAGAVGYVDGPLFEEELCEVVEQALNGPHPVKHPRWAPRMRLPELPLNYLLWPKAPWIPAFVSV